MLVALAGESLPMSSLWSISRVGQKKVSPTTIDDDDDVDDSREA